MRRGENPSVVLAARARGARRLNRRLAGRRRAASSPFYDRTELVDTTLKTVGRNLVEGALLVTLVLFVFLLDLRAALIVAVAHPALARCRRSSTCTLRGMCANLLSMGAVDFGIIVDGGVVIIEAILAAHSR